MPLSLEEILELAQQLPRADKGRLIARLAEDLVGDTPSPASSAAHFALPVLEGGTWSDDLPLSRRELYDDDERC